MKKNKNIPALRFPGFKEPWKEKRISDLLERRSEPVVVEPTSTYREIGVRSHGRGVFHKEPILGEALGDKRVFHVVPHTLVLNIVFAWEQAVAILTEAETGFIASHRFPMYAEKNGQSYIPFMQALFLRPRGKFLLELASPGGAGRNKTLGQEEFGKLTVTVPDRAEQKKIADLLQVIDAKILELEKKKLLLEAFKKGCLQEIFSHRLRFQSARGTPYSDWDTGLLKDFAVINPSSGQLPEEFYYIDLESVDGGLLNDPSLTSKANAPSRAQRILESGDVLFQLVRPYQRNNLLFKNNSKLRYVASTGYAQLRANCYPPFLYQLLHEDTFVSKVLERCTGAGYPAITAPELGRIEVAVPSDSDEQKKIADFLGALDDRIYSARTALNHVSAFKNGLLQQMFV